MRIKLKQIGKRYNREWIFRDVDYVFETHSKTVILGPNGSGKSTLLQIVSGILTPTKGEISYTLNDQTISVDDIFRNLSIAAPYLELIEELTLEEMIDFHFSFKEIDQRTDKKKLLPLLGMEKVAGKPIRYFSSGMKQRVKLALALCSATPLVLLDEPASNLDVQGIEWYNQLIDTFASDKTVIVCSNQENEYRFCTERISITDYKM